MKTMNVAKSLRSLAAIATLTLLPAATHGAGVTLVEDIFDRFGPLVGSDANTGQTWGGSSAYNTFGSFYQVDGDTTSFATISGLTFLPSSTYCLSVDMTIFLPISNGYLGLGFKESTSTGIFADTVGAFQLTESAIVRSHPVDNTLPQVDTVTGTSHNLQIILTTGTTLANSSLEWIWDTTSVRSGVAVDASDIDGIFLAHESTDNLFRAQFQRLLLEGPIPEPSAAMLLALGGVGALVRRKR